MIGVVHFHSVAPDFAARAEDALPALAARLIEVAPDGSVAVRASDRA